MSFKFSVHSLLLLSFALVLLGVSVAPAQAASTVPVLTLTVNGGENASVVNGEEVELGWYIDGPVENCRVSDIGLIDTSVLPVSGTTSVIATADGTASYTLECDAVAEVVEINTNLPVIDMSIREGDDLMTNSLTGRVDSVIVDWSASNSDGCDLLQRESVSAPGVLITETNTNDYWGRYAAGGTVRYDGWPREIRETTTFYITCRNDAIGESVTQSITLNVANGAPPLPPLVNVVSPNFPQVTQSEVYGYAYVDVSFVSANVTSCTKRAYYLDGAQYSPNPPNYGSASQYLSGNYTNIRLSTTTDFEVTCSRGEVTLAGVTYPATSTTDRLRIEVVPPAGVADANSWDRSGAGAVPPVVATIDADPNPTVESPLTGLARTHLAVTSQYSSRCHLKAFRLDGAQRFISGWTRTIVGANIDWGIDVNISTTTRFTIDCVRDYDLSFGTAADLANGRDVKEVWVVVEESAVELPPPVVYLYGDNVRLAGDYIWNNALSKTGFDRLFADGGNYYLENAAAGASVNSITFPFSGPSETYNLHFAVCDENDGESTFTFSTENSGELGTWTTNGVSSAVYGTAGACGRYSVEYRLVAPGVTLQDGEEINIQCTTPDDGERCGFSNVYFGNQNTYVTDQVNPVVTSVEAPIMWLSENTTTCNQYVAMRPDGSAYNWHGNTNHTNYRKTVTLSTSTMFSVTCGRNIDGEVFTDTDTTGVYVPYSFTLSAATTISAGQCLDDGTLGGMFGQPVTAPAGYGPDENGFCSPLLDLAAEAPALSDAEVTIDNVNGTYDNLKALLVILNLGPGGLPADSGVSYLANLAVDAYHSIPAIETSLGSYDGELTAPDEDGGAPTESAVLTRFFMDIPFGSHVLCSRVNLDGSPNIAESNDDPTNNMNCSSVSLPVPKPPMSITADKDFIRPNESVLVSWSAHTSYPMSCTVRGAAGVTDDFDASANYPSPPGSGLAYTNQIQSASIDSTSRFVLQCTEPHTGTVFTETLQVEVVPEPIET